ncbi:hypothetical protein F5Y11DRAFT_345178 [Daldinia sp. FL1419]|nr:hypothetical protein F5Y11DRAFT_345178 [Daldinia sp. FL1419]
MSSYDANTNGSVGANKGNDEKQPATPQGLSKNFLGYGSCTYPIHQREPTPGSKLGNQPHLANLSHLPTGYLPTTRPFGPPRVPTVASHIVQQGTAPPPGLVPPPGIPFPMPHTQSFPPLGSQNYAFQTSYGGRASPSYHPETIPSTTVSPATPRVVLPPSRGHQQRPSSLTPTHPRGRGKGQGASSTSPPPFAPTGPRMAADPRQTTAGGPAFNNHYPPIHTHTFQNPYQVQQTQMGQPPTNSPAHPITHQKPKPVIDRHARQRMLDEQAKSFSEEDDAAFYPHNN